MINLVFFQQPTTSPPIMMMNNCNRNNSIIDFLIFNVTPFQKKCDQYWPKEGCENYGFIQVTLLHEEVLATYTIRKFSIKHLKVKCKKSGGGERIVYQYHYTNWPDHGTPDHPLPVLSFVRKSAAANPEDAGPIIVHCSNILRKLDHCVV
ncbi:Tyrosine-protein phosphatase 99A [Armadillidium vulgare]|nr:Tyrosine-protein phosphatase 99A [Armadillidium vulgare]